MYGNKTTDNLIYIIEGSFANTINIFDGLSQPDNQWNAKNPRLDIYIITTDITGSALSDELRLTFQLNFPPIVYNLPIWILENDDFTIRYQGNMAYYAEGSSPAFCKTWHGVLNYAFPRSFRINCFLNLAFSGKYKFIFSGDNT